MRGARNDLEFHRGTRTQNPNLQSPQVVSLLCPVGSQNDPPTKPFDVEPELARMHVDCFFLRRQQIEQKGAAMARFEEFGHGAIAAAESTAAATVREDDESDR